MQSLRAANRRFSTKDSLKALSNILLGLSIEENEQEEMSPVEIMNACPSPATQPARRSARNSSTPQVRMPCVQGISGKTPGRRSVVDNLPAEFSERCVNCGGTFPSIKYDPLKKEQRVACSMCRRKTAQFCWKCRRHLYNEAPLKGRGRDGKTYPKDFSVKVPVLKGGGSLKRDRDVLETVLETEVSTRA